MTSGLQDLKLVERAGVKYVTILTGSRFILSAKTVNGLVGECLSSGIARVLVTEKHIPEAFFSLRSLEAGEILQKCRTYGIKLAIVVSRRRLQAGRFKEMASEEGRGNTFAVFTDPCEAEEWLLNPDLPNVLGC